MAIRDVTSSIRRDKVALSGAVVLGFLIVVAVLAPVVAPYHPDAILRDVDGSVKVWHPPSADHPFGTTSLGRDVLSQVVWGSRTALVVGLWAAVIATAIGFWLGLIAGHFRGAADTIVSRVVELAYSIPFEPLAIVVIALISPNVSTLILVISIVLWRPATRAVRNQGMAMQGATFVKASKLSGAGSWWIMSRHMAPLLLPIAFVYAPVGFGNAILAEASLSFLGFGDPASISWGETLRTAFDQGAMYSGLWWVIAPGLAITVATAAVFLVTRPFEEVLDPRLRKG